MKRVEPTEGCLCNTCEELREVIADSQVEDTTVEGDVVEADDLEDDEVEELPDGIPEEEEVK